MALSNLQNDFLAFVVDGTHFLVAQTTHPNPCWSSYWQQAPGLLPDPVTGGGGQTTVYEFHSDPPAPGTICIQVLRPMVIPLRAPAPPSGYFVVLDGHGFHQVPVVPVV